MRLRTRFGGWRRVERYRGQGRLTASDTLPSQPIEYEIEVWEQFLGGRGGRYKIEGQINLERTFDGESTATLVLEDGIRLYCRVFGDGHCLGDSPPQFPDCESA